MASRKGEDAGTLSTARKLILFVVVTAILILLYVFLQERSMENLEPLFNPKIFNP